MLYGTVTMRDRYANGLAKKIPVSSFQYPKEDYIAASGQQNYIISLDPDGILGWDTNCVEKAPFPNAHIVEVLTEQVSNDYLSYLRKYNISYIFAGRESLDCALLLHKSAHLFGIERLMISGGGYTNWSFLQENLVDELSLLISPIADGNTSSVSIFEKGDFLPVKTPTAFSLKEVKVTARDGVWLRYLIK